VGWFQARPADNRASILSVADGNPALECGIRVRERSIGLTSGYHGRRDPATRRSLLPPSSWSRCSIGWLEIVTSKLFPGIGPELPHCTVGGEVALEQCHRSLDCKLGGSWIFTLGEWRMTRGCGGEFVYMRA
jgi:hypothetical protein